VFSLAAPPSPPLLSSINVSSSSSSGAAHLGVLMRGDYFGEIALLQKTVRTATLMTLENCTLLYLSYVAFPLSLSHTNGWPQPFPISCPPVSSPLFHSSPLAHASFVLPCFFFCPRERYPVLYIIHARLLDFMCCSAEKFQTFLKLAPEVNYDGMFETIVQRCVWRARSCMCGSE
jgi:hypothetical protein